MRKTLFTLAPAFALALALTGCGDDSSPTSSAPALTTQDKQNLASLPMMLAQEKPMLDGYAKNASTMATGFVGNFQPSAGAGRVAAGTCTGGAFDTSFSAAGMSTTMKITKADGSAFTNCEQVMAAYLSTDGIGIQMTMAMNMNEQGMSTSLNMSYNMIYKPIVATGGYNMSLTMTMTSTEVANGQTINMSINPMTMTMTAETKTATPTMAGSMTMSYDGLSFANLKFSDAGISPSQTIDILKDGSKVATLTIDAAGQGTVKDLNGNVITG